MGDLSRLQRFYASRAIVGLDWSGFADEGMGGQGTVRGVSGLGWCVCLYCTVEGEELGMRMGMGDGDGDADRR